MALDQAAFTLSIVQGARLRVGFRYKVDDVAQPLDGYSFRGAIRAKEDISSLLLLDLTPHLAVDSGDATQLWLDVPASVTAALDEKAMSRSGVAWDIFMWPGGDVDSAQLLIQGGVEFDASATDMRASSGG